MKKICFITTISFTLKMFLLETAKYLHEEGNYDITFICDYNKEFEKELPDYIHYIPVKMKRGISLSDIISIYKLYKIFKKEKFNIIQYSTPNASLYCSIAGKLAKIKVRLYCQWGIRYSGFKGIKRKIFKILEKITCNNSTWIEPDSYGNLKFAHKEKLYTTDKSSVVWNGSAAGINLEKFDIEKKQLWRKEIREKYEIKDEIVIGFVGRIEADKGINELIGAFKKLNDNNIKLLIIGPLDKPDTINQELYCWAKENNNIIFTGIVSETEKYYSAMDIFVLPSYREGFGSVTIEAEAMGVPVIVSNILGPTEAIEKDKTGIIVEARNQKSLEEALNKMIKDKKMRQKMSQEAVNFSKNKFDNKKLFKYILEDRDKLIM